VGVFSISKPTPFIDLPPLTKLIEWSWYKVRCILFILSRDESRSFIQAYPISQTLTVNRPPRPAEPVPSLDHYYTTPNLYDAQNETTSFSTNADVIPRLGTLKSQKKNQVDKKMDAESQAPVPVSIPNPKPGNETDDYYDKVFDDGYDRPKSIKVDMKEGGVKQGGVKQTYTDGYDRPRSLATELSAPPDSGSLKKTESLFEVRDELRTINHFAGTTFPRPAQSSTELASNPLYDPRFRRDFV
jgi:hypothetical protein